MPTYTGEVTHIELANLPLWLIALFPFLGALTNAIFGRKLQASSWNEGLKKKFHIGSPGVSAVAVGAMLCAFVVAVISFVQLVGLPAEHRYLYTHGWQMLRIGSLDVSFSMAMDPLSGLMTLIITGVGSLIHVYATSYMETEEAYWRFFTYLNLFVFAMLLLVLGDNMIVMFFGWEGVGLCSYLLIGFWYKDYKKATAGMKAFVVNRVGDWGFICGMALLFWGLGGAWLASTGDYMPDFRARFVPVLKQAINLHGGAHGGGHGDTGHGDAAHGDAGHGDHAHDGAGHGDGFGVDGPLLAQNDPPRPEGAGHDHGSGQGRGRGTGKGHGTGEGTGNDKGSRGGRAGIAAPSGEPGSMTLTSHAGARVFLGVSTLEQLRSSMVNLERCNDRQSWKAASGLQLTPDCYAEAPFVRKRLPAGVHQVVIVPGDGAVVSGDGNEVAGFHAQVEAGRETVITAVGPTLTFRELHDQLEIADESGTQFVKESLKDKTAWGIGLITLACLCFFVGATGKSAQIPLYVWLPDAMAGPTPVSALIHAATMVTAGVYMIARMNFLFGLTPEASGVIALVGALTALFAATMGFFQYDLKKVLAYSTVSQLGFMFIGVGVGAYWAGVFHLMTHAFFKACLFLAAGSVIHGMHHLIHDEVGSQDMRNMGGLRALMPDTARTYKIACIAITAAPPGLAGFWSKDEILWKAFNSNHTSFVPGPVIYAIGLLAAVGTSFYMWRSYYLTFEGKHAHKAAKKKVHESPKPITYVLWALAALSAVSGVVLGISSHFTGGIGEGVLPHEPLFEQWLAPVLAHHEASIGDAGYPAMYGLMALSVAGAIGAWGIAQRIYGADRGDWEAAEKRVPGFEAMQNKYWVDEIYEASFVAAFRKGRIVLAEMDRWIVDGLVNGAGVASKTVAWISGAIDRYLVDGAVNFVANGLLKAGTALRGMQTGQVQNYVYGILGGVAFLAIIQYFLG